MKMAVVTKGIYQSHHQKFHANHGQHNILTATQWYQHILNLRKSLITAEIHMVQAKDHGVLQVIRIRDGNNVIYKFVHQVRRIYCINILNST